MALMLTIFKPYILSTLLFYHIKIKQNEKFNRKRISH